MSQENTLRMALTALESCSGAPHWDSLQPTVTAIKKALVAQPAVQGGSCGHESCDCRSYCKKQQPASNQELTKQDFGGDCDTPPEPWSAIWVAWNSEDGFTFWATEKQADLWSAADSNEWPVQYAMQKAQPAVPLTDEQINQIIDSISLYRGEYSVAIARAIEAAHGITEKGQP